jgi:tetratricopeptide (TPR) repeat protein
MQKLTKQGITALHNGKKDKARKLLSQAVRKNPNDKKAWLALASIVTKPEHRYQCLQHVLNIEPDHPVALRELKKLKEQQKPKKSIPNKTFIYAAIGTIVFLCIIIYGVLFKVINQPQPTAAALLPTNTPKDTVTDTLIPTQTYTPQPSPTDQATGLTCQPASQAQFNRVQEGIQSLQASNYIQSAYALKSNDFENVYFVAAIIYGPNMESGVGPGIWAISGDPNQPKIALSIDGYATEFTQYPDANSTDFELSMSNHGAQEVKQCAEANKTTVPISTSTIKPAKAQTPEAICQCSYDAYNCPDLVTHARAQACFDYCRSLGYDDPHRLDRNDDGVACESLP